MDDRPIARMPRFREGDLITADDLNRMVEALKTLDRRVAALEAACGASGSPGADRYTLIEEAVPGLSVSRIATPLAWDELVVSADVREQLVALEHWLSRSSKPPLDWDTEPERQGGRSALFRGPPGAGKRVSAAMLGKLTAREVYAADLARVVSKYIGETEKNLDAVFDAAERAGAILLFDEADALFGRRSEVKDAHDRFANTAADVLLERLESHGGLAVLMSDSRRDIDEAFLRRLDVVIDFPPPA